jgi:hypothetical protein
MGQERAGIAIARIERALARIEAAAARPAAASPAANAADDRQVTELRRAHLALRARVEGAIAQIDGLLATGEQG